MAIAAPGTSTKAIRGLAFAPQTAPAPQVFVSTTGTLNAGSTASGTAGSTVVSYDVGGQYLTGAITVTAPANYEVSLSSGSGFGSSVTTAAPSSAATGSLVAATRIYVRLSGGGSGTVTGNVANTSPGATTRNVAMTGSVTAPATLTTSTASLSGFSTTEGTPSAAQSYTLTGSNLTGSVTVTAPTGYEVAQDGGTNYAATQAVMPSSGSVNTSIAVRLASTAAAGTASGNVGNASSGATTVNVAVTGRVVGKPTGTPAFTSASTTFNSVTLNLTPAADGTNLLVVVRPTGSTATAPTDGTAYTANTTYPTGQALGSGFVVLAAPNATSVTVMGLNSGTSYVADVYTYNVGTVAGFENYGLTSGTTTFTTPVQVPAAAGVLPLEENFDYPSGTVLAGGSTGWQAIGDSANIITTATGNLSSSTYQYPQGVLSAAPAGTSTRVPLASNGQDIYKTFGSRPSGATAVYAAALVNVSATLTGGDAFLTFGIDGANARGRVVLRTSGTGYNVGLRLTSVSETPVWGTTVYSYGTPYLLVLKYDNSTATSNVDVASVYLVNPTTVPTSEPTPEAVFTRSGSTNSATLLNSVQLYQGDATIAPTLVIDALRIGTGWGTVVGRPVYSSGSSTIAAGSYYSLRVAGSGTVATVGTTGPGNGVTAATVVVLEKQLNLDGGQVAVPATTSTSPNPLLLRNRTIGDSFEILANGGTSYVDGPVSRETVGGLSLLFPLGRSDNYRPVTLNITTAPSGTTIYTATQVEASAYSGDATVNSPLTRVSRVRYFSIVSNPVPATMAFAGSVTLSFGPDDQVSDPSLASFVVAKSDGAGWSNVGRQGNSSSTLTSNSFYDFSLFALASTSPVVADNPLPVELTAFTAVRSADKGVALAWTTASEKNSSHFDVERSLDGRTFAAVAPVQAAGSSAQARSYRSLDADAPAAQLYYRLRMVDLDGKLSYSPTVAVAAGGAGELTLAPNPAHAQLSVLTEQAAAYVVRTPLGQVVLSGSTAAGAATTLDVSQLAGGVYFFELRGAAGRTVRRFIKE